MLLAKLQIVFSELDHYENGCTGQHFTGHWDLSFNAENEQVLIEKMTAYFLCTSDYFQFNACDEVGRTDIQLQTVNKFDEFPMNKGNLERFKDGKIEAYLTTFSFQVYEQKPFNLITKDS